MVEIFSYDEVYKAYRECSKNKRHTPNAALFEIDENKKVYILYEILNSDKYEIGKSITFLDEFPNYREIFAADFICKSLRKDSGSSYKVILFRFEPCEILALSIIESALYKEDRTAGC